MSHLQHMAKKEIFQLINNRFIWPLVYNINAATIFPPPSLLVTLEACVPYRTVYCQHYLSLPTPGIFQPGLLQ